MNDNSLRGPQWQRLVGDFFVPRLGGTHAQWSDANQQVLDAFFERMIARWQAWDEASDDYVRTCEEFDLDWLSSMCSRVGVAAPSDVAEQARLVKEASAYIEPQVRATFPGVVGALHALARDYVLYMASTASSWELEHRLGAMGVRGLFTQLYGPDLVNVPKTGRRYYERVFEHACVDPATALVVDDKAEFLDHAASLGAHTVLVTGLDSSPRRRRVSALSQLPSLLESQAE